MARIKEKDAMKGAVIQVANLTLAAAYNAPQLTGRLKIQTEILTDEDLDPIIEYLGAISPIAPVIALDYETVKYYRENDSPLVIVLIGADVTKSELGWDCGACGFKSCAEFNKYGKDNRDSSGGGGPSCHWKVIDYGMACDFACAAAAQYRVECRPMGTIGTGAAMVGYLPGCLINAIPIGPPGESIYFSRKSNVDAFTYEKHRENFFRSSPTNWLAFAGNSRPEFKTKQDWWNDMDYVKWGPLSDEEKQAAFEALIKSGEISAKYSDRISSFYKKNEKNKKD